MTFVSFWGALRAVRRSCGVFSATEHVGRQHPTCLSVTVFAIIIVIDFDSKMIKESFLAISNFFSHVDDNGGTNDDDDDDDNRDGDFGDDDGDDDENDDNVMFGLSPTSGGALEGHAAGKATIHPTISARCVCFKGG